MQVELVSTQTTDGVRLDGALRRPAERGAARLGVDLVICHHGMGGNFYGPSFFDGIGDALVREGCAVLRVNSRAHDTLYAAPQGLLGAATEIGDDCRADWNAWLEFGAARGYQRIVLWGHSQGAVKTIYYLGTEGGSRLVGAIASSPARFSYEACVASEQAAVFMADLEQAQQLVARGEGRRLFLASFPAAGYFSARTYLDKYGPESRYDFFKYLPRVDVPLLLTLGSAEGGLLFGDLAARGASLPDQYPNVSFAMVAGADHSYGTRVGELWEIARGWLERVAAPAAVG